MAKKPAISKSANNPAKGLDGASDEGGASAEGSDPFAIVAPAVTSLEQVLGQGRAVATLKQSMASGRVHHAWIFSGPPGVGKRTAAVAFGLELLADRTPPEASMFGEPEPAAAKVDVDHPDLHTVHKSLAEFSRDDATRRGKQTTLSQEVLVEFLIEPAYRARSVQADSLAHKVFIVDEAEYIAPAVQNILLKVIEEPPPGTIIILVTTQENELLATIRSRCQRVQFAPASGDAMQQWLSKVRSPIDAEEKAWLLANFGSSPGQFSEAFANRMITWRPTLDGVWNDVISPLSQSGSAGLTPKFLSASALLGNALTKLVTDRIDAAKKDTDEAGKSTIQRLWTLRLLTVLADRARRMLFAAVSRQQTAAQQALCKVIEELVTAEQLLDRNVRYDAVLENVATQISEIVQQHLAAPTATAR
jgi:DNA polymerase III subunit delta'